jgi:putative phosphoribosyl transferase
VNSIWNANSSPFFGLAWDSQSSLQHAILVEGKREGERERVMHTGLTGAKVEIPPHHLPGILSGVEGQTSPIVVIAQCGGGSGRGYPHNLRVALALEKAGFRILLVDLLTAMEAHNPDMAFDIPVLSDRLNDAVEWLRSHPETASSPLGLFGSGASTAAALNVAAARRDAIRALVSRSGRPDLSDALAEVEAPTLCIVGQLDPLLIEINGLALPEMNCVKQLVIVPGAAHLFEEPGTMDIVVDEARAWFTRHLLGS